MGMHVGLIEQMILNYDALPKEFYGWRNFRIEYGGHAQDCIMERPIFVPPNFDVHKFEDELREAAESFDIELYRKQMNEKFPTEDQEP
ncbi:hypothetical protein LCGC14_2205080 [marine sediment metagenome]|uniref:Uncharacterized protein n=1 Tax=marine sediment metagenome TaxID=412755 RepID=A0A0F9DFH2_9ZZZZ